VRINEFLGCFLIIIICFVAAAVMGSRSFFLFLFELFFHDAGARL